MKRILSQFLLSYLRFFARIALKQHTPYVIGVAGSVGKSSTRNALYAMLKEYYPTKMIYGNSETGIPLGILGIHQERFTYASWLRSMLQAPFGMSYLRKTKYLIVEMGIDEPFPPKNMAYLLTIITPDLAISLNVSATHTEQFEKILKKNQQFSTEQEKLSFLIQAIATEDTKIITQSQCKIGIYNKDNEYIYKSLANFSGGTTKLLSFGNEADNDISYHSYIVSLASTSFSFTIHNEQITLSFPHLILPKEYQELLAAVILSGKELHLTTEQITTALQKNFTLPKGRGSIFPGIRNSLIVDSSYNASKDAVKAFLSLLKTLKKQTNKEVVFLFGDMRELGEESKTEHEAVATIINTIVDRVYLVGPQTKQYVLPILEKDKGSLTEMQWFETAIDAGEYLADKLPEDSLLLVKGSQNTIFLEEAIVFLLENASDISQLCRQEKTWKEVKQHYFQSKQKTLLSRKH